LDQDQTIILARIAAALERLAPAPPQTPDLSGADAYIWHAARSELLPISRVSKVESALLQGIDRQKQILFENTRRFAAGLPANNAMLWGARGMGKSSLVKAAHAEASRAHPGSLVLVEIPRDDLPSLGILLDQLRAQPRRCLLFCDDLSFESEDSGYKALKSVLDGGIAGRPANVLFYATSNRRHLMPREMIENERATAIHENEAIEEKLSLSDRFGLWIGFHSCTQTTYHDIVKGYAEALGLGVPEDVLLAGANEWSITRGARSGRVAWQYIQEVAGRSGGQPTG
jgi:predicted AAA+ superfamily ATPase